MAVTTAHNKAVQELVEALGCPKNATELTLHIKYNELVTMTVVHYVDLSSICGLARTIKKFELKEKE